MSAHEKAWTRLAAARARIAEGTAPLHWRSLDELADTADFLAHLEAEFPRFAAAAAGALDRRRFLQLAGASLALAGLGGCGPEQPPEEIIPNVVDPPRPRAGETQVFASAVVPDGYATGVLVTHSIGRPIKIEGNPDHPASLGATDVLGQAAILDLYDPDRAQAVTSGGRIRGWEAFLAALRQRLNDPARRGGKGMRLLTGTVTSPSLAARIAGLRQVFPELRWHRWDALNRDEERAGTRLVFGRPLDPIPHPDRADVILAVGSDLLSEAPGHLRFARDFAARRRPGPGMLRLYAIESTPTLTGAAADHRFPLRPDEIAAALAAIAGAAGIDVRQPDAPAPPWTAAVAADLMQHRGRVLVHVGREQPAAFHALAAQLNHALGDATPAATYVEPVEADPVSHRQSLSDLVADMAAGKVETLILFGTNPVFTAPADLGFAAALRRVPFSVTLATHRDETAAAALWHVPQAHELESWGDARAFDGTASVLQPQIRPLYGGRSPHEFLAALAGDETAPLASLREFWERQHAGLDWQETLRSGIVAGSAAPAVTPMPRGDPINLPTLARSGLTLLFRPDPYLRDGRFANNSWLQELPRPFSKLTWDNAALVAPRTAERLGLENGDLVEITAAGGRAGAPVWILPGQAEDCVTLPLGGGRRVAGRVGAGVGFDPYPLRSAGALWQLAGASLRKTGSRHRLASTQNHHAMAGKDLVRVGTLAEFERDPDFLADEPPKETLYPAWRYEGVAWGMQIDLNACLGCNACAVACQAENNVPVVGKEEVLRGREMHWLRIDRYYEGEPEAPATLFQPVLCMHCEEAPCEVVCPVQATMHDREGLNTMVYNRCVGTRFCSNNCPYKVRRFNYFGYARAEPRPAEARNPDVTVRSRGVMEKCSYCLQRISAARIAADRDSRPIADGEVVTACQAACPTRAITFGDINDRASAVSRAKASPLDYALLGELNTRPRTSYGARLRNPNPALGGSEA